MSIFGRGASFDLHVLSTPPAFILSQDQTLMLKNFSLKNLKYRKRYFIKFNRLESMHGIYPFDYCCFVRNVRYYLVSRIESGWFHSVRMSFSEKLYFYNFSRLFHCSIIKVLDAIWSASANTILSKKYSVVNTFFDFFQVLFFQKIWKTWTRQRDIS